MGKKITVEHVAREIEKLTYQHSIDNYPSMVMYFVVNYLFPALYTAAYPGVYKKHGPISVSERVANKVNSMIGRFLKEDYVCDCEEPACQLFRDILKVEGMDVFVTMMKEGIVPIETDEYSEAQEDSIETYVVANGNEQLSDEQLDLLNDIVKKLKTSDGKMN